jgi:hypothetical protein
MDEVTYFELLQLITPLIVKQDMKIDHHHERLTLRFIASGCSYKHLQFTTIISPKLLGEIIPTIYLFIN